MNLLILKMILRFFKNCTRSLLNAKKKDEMGRNSLNNYFYFFILSLKESFEEPI